MQINSKLQQPNIATEVIRTYASNYPTLTAIKTQLEVLNYTDFFSLSIKLADYINRNYSIRENSVVALIATPSIEQVISLFAINMTGGCVAVLNGKDGVNQLANVVNKISPQLIIFDEIYANTCSAFEQYPQWIISRPAIRDWKGTSPKHNATPASPAAIFQTSGTTGDPKLVVMPFGKAADPPRVAAGTEQHIYKTASSTTFSRYEMMRPLLAGQTLNIISTTDSESISSITNYIDDNKITNILLPPTILLAILNGIDRKKLRSLKHVTCSGEAITKSLKNKFFETLDADLTVIYGCTEAPSVASKLIEKLNYAADADCYEIHKDKEVYILDENMIPVGYGMSGEIYVGGSIALGYVDDKFSENLKFITNPFKSSANVVLYKTGDLGKINTNGTLEIFGRSDRVIKKSGFRIDLDNISNLIKDIDGVDDAYAISIENKYGGVYVKAFIVSKCSPAITENTIKNILKDRIPSYAIPATIIRRVEFPKLTNGKMDVNKLLKDGSGIEVKNELNHTPLAGVEKEIEDLICQITGREHISTTDTFSDIGGDSLLALELSLGVAQKFLIKVREDEFLTQESLIKLVKNKIDRKNTSGNKDGIFKIREGGGKNIYLIPPLHGGLFCYRHLTKFIPPEFAIYGVVADFIKNTKAVDYSITSIADTITREIVKFDERKHISLIGYSAGGLIANEVTFNLVENGRVCQLYLLDTYFPKKVRWYSILSAIYHSFRHKRNLLNPIRRYYIVKILRHVGIVPSEKYVLTWCQVSHTPSHHREPTTYFKSTVSTGKNDNANRWSQHFRKKLNIIDVDRSHKDFINSDECIDIGERITSRGNNNEP